MALYARRFLHRERPSKDQQNFLQTLRDLGPQDNAETAEFRIATKRACQVRGWVEWRCRDEFPGIRGWHLTIIGRKALNSPRRSSRAMFVRARPAPVPKSPNDSPEVHNSETPAGLLGQEYGPRSRC
jgi:hypothetical protein